MSDIRSKVQSIEPSAYARNVKELAAETGNIYEVLNIIGKRANQISVDIKSELQVKLREFAAGTDNLEEVNENKEQIEISKFYERLPNPVNIAINEFENDELAWKYNSEIIES